MVANRTYGFNVTQTTIPNAGDFSIWDFSGRKDYYIGHESFLQERNAIFLIVFSLKDPVDRQLMQVQHWLAMIKAKQSTAKYVSYRRHSTTKPFVVLVGSFADQQPPLLESVPSESGNGQAFAVPSAASVLNAKMDNGKSVFGKVVSQYSPYFVFPDIVYTLDCRLSQTQESKALRSLLGHLRQELIKVCQLHLCSFFINHLITLLSNTVPCPLALSQPYTTTLPYSVQSMLKREDILSNLLHFTTLIYYRNTLMFPALPRPSQMYWSYGAWSTKIYLYLPGRDIMKRLGHMSTLWCHMTNFDQSH